MTERWRTGRSVGRTIYRMVGKVASKDDALIGVMDTPQLAVKVVASVTSCEHVTAERDALKAVIERTQVLVDKMRHGADPFGGSAADSADLLDAALVVPESTETPRPAWHVHGGCTHPGTRASCPEPECRTPDAPKGGED